MSAHLSLNQLSKFYGNVQALNNVSLDVNEGEFVCLLGPSGCGKTTLLRIIAGFEEASGGDILLKGERINQKPPHKRDFGMVFQSLALFPHMTVSENIAYGMKRKGIAKSAHAKRIDELLEMVKLPNIANRKVIELSGGQQQRVAIARALAVPPKLFLLDEPLSALDAQIRENMQIELRQLQQQFGVTTILVTHDQHEAMILADRLVILRNGAIQQVATPSDMYRQPNNEFVAEFLGAANLLPGTVKDAGHIELLGQTIAMPNDFAIGQSVKLAARSEDIVLHQVNNSQNALIGEVTFVRDLGAKAEILVRCGETVIRCHPHHKETQSFQVGNKVAVHLVIEHCAVFPS